MPGDQAGLVDVRQLHVEQHRIGAQRRNGGERRASVRALPHQLVAPRLPPAGQPGAEARVVIDDQCHAASWHGGGLKVQSQSARVRHDRCARERPPGLGPEGMTSSSDPRRPARHARSRRFLSNQVEPSATTAAYKRVPQCPLANRRYAITDARFPSVLLDEPLSLRRVAVWAPGGGSPPAARPRRHLGAARLFSLVERYRAVDALHGAGYAAHATYFVRRWR